MSYEHVFVPMHVQQQGLSYKLFLAPLHFVCPQPISLQCYVFILIYHILWLHIFHDVNVVIPSMIWVSICYVARVGMNTLKPMIRFEIPLQLSRWKMEPTYKKKVSHLFSYHTRKRVDIVITKNGFQTLVNIIIANLIRTNLV
jgi:hypothetical protein